MRPSRRLPAGMHDFAAKRCFDVAMGSMLFMASLPILVVIAIGIKIDSSGKVLFIQERVGRNGKLFNLIKFRTFRRESFGIFPDREIAYNDVRITRIGTVLRRTKLDELPQLVNILKGEMSFVGPRPDIPAQVRGYSEDQRKRLLVLPGLTGVAQISGNTGLTWGSRIRLDNWYVDNLRPALDLLILVHTIPAILRGENGPRDPLGVYPKVFAVSVR